MIFLPYIDFQSRVLLYYPQVLQMLVSNTYGKIWMIGGSVTRTILDCIRNPNSMPKFDYWNLYSLGKFPFRDLDFIVEEICSDFSILPGWEVKVNTFGGIKLLRKSPFNGQVITIDIWELRNHEPCRRNGIPCTIENVLRSAPLSVQSIAFDLQEGKLLGEVGINSICTGTVMINHERETENYCRIYKTTLQEFLEKKALEYDFTPIL